MINVPDNLQRKIKHPKSDPIDTEYDAPQQASWGDAQQALEGAGVNLKWEVVEGCCMTVHWPELGLAKSKRPDYSEPLDSP